MNAFFRTLSITLIVLTFLASLNSPILARESDDSTPAKGEAKAIEPPTLFKTDHEGRFNNEKISYKAIAGETYLRDLNAQPKASIFSFAYVKKTKKNEQNRPVTFLWNGGPGSASTWLHMGGYGPKRIVVPSNATHPGLPPYEIKDAPETLLDISDLVFIDPVGTGFSRALGDHESKEFWGLYEDAQSMAEFIRTWMTENDRWNSPVFIIGESYGTTRAAAVANILESDMSIPVSGLVFVSQALDYQGSSPYIANNLISHITYLPTMAATAFYHGKVSPKPESKEVFLEQARAFATNELLPALFKGSSIDAAEYTQVRDRLAYFTGLTTDYIDQVNLRVQGFRFAKQLLREQGLAVGLLDGRYTKDELDDINADVAADAASDAIGSAYKASLMIHMRRNLNIDWLRPYLSSADPDLQPNWNYRTTPKGTSYEPSFVNTSADLSKAMRTNPHLKVFIAAGYYDLVTPFFDAEYTLGRHGIPKQRVVFEYYEGGHMMYVNEQARVKLLQDTRKFIHGQLK